MSVRSVQCRQPGRGGEQAYRGKGAIGKHHEKCHGNAQPESSVGQTFFQLRSLPVKIADAAVVLAKASDCDITLPSGKSFGSNWIGRQIEQNHEGPDDSHSPGNEIHVLPGVQGAPADLTEPIVDKRRNCSKIAGAAEPCLSYRSARPEATDIEGLQHTPIRSACSALDSTN